MEEIWHLDIQILKIFACGAAKMNKAVFTTLTSIE